MLIEISTRAMLQHLNAVCDGAQGLAKQLLSISPESWSTQVEVPRLEPMDRLLKFGTGGFFELSYSPWWLGKQIENLTERSSGTFFVQDLWLNAKQLSPFYAGDQGEMFNQFGSAYFWLSSNNFSPERANRIARSTRSFKLLAAYSNFVLHDQDVRPDFQIDSKKFETLLANIAGYYVEIYDGESYAVIRPK